MCMYNTASKHLHLSFNINFQKHTATLKKFGIIFNRVPMENVPNWKNLPENFKILNAGKLLRE